MLTDCVYELHEIAPEDLASFMKERAFCGVNVTIPYKEKVIPFLDEVEENAKRIGAVNTVVNKDGRLYGYNTDVYGLHALITRLGVSLDGKKALILGTGGTSKTAEHVLHMLHAGEIRKVSRHPDPSKGEISYEQAVKDHADAGFVINTTPSGMFPHPEQCPLDLSDFAKLTGVVDVIYNPHQTTLLANAYKRGIPAAGGLYMLVMQAVKASELFFDTTYAKEMTEEIFHTMEVRKQNVVLTGMPASGKSTVGRILADRLERDFADTDAMIVARENREISQIFAENGEAYFRDLETEVIRELSQRGGAVIATGGGAILRDENVSLLKRNGQIYFLDRALSELLPTDDRPLADSADKITALYEKRYDRYLATCDKRINCADIVGTDRSCDPDAAAKSVADRIYTLFVGT